MVNLTFGIPLRKAVRYIAITDMALACFLVLFRLISGTVRYEQSQYKIEVEVPLDWNGSDYSTGYTTPGYGMSIQDGTSERHFQLRTDASISKVAKDLNGSDYVTGYTTPGYGVSIHDATSERNFQLRPDASKSKELVMIVGLMAIFVDMAILIFEVYMCRLLLAVSKNEDKELCKRWFWIRLPLVILVFIAVVTAIATGLINDWLDYVVQTTVIYRIYSLIVIHSYKNELGRTGGRYLP